MNLSIKLRNIAIIAHVDHGKTTLVDKLLQQSGTLAKGATPERVMDSNDLERERGITILAKNTAINWKEHHINIVDTPGHADFGGEVERILSMVDSVLLIVDATDGPMPQTRFVTQKAFAYGLKPIVVINKIDRDSARPHAVIDEVFDLFDKLGANDEQLDFSVVYASALKGYAGLELDKMGTDMSVLLDTIIEHVPPPKVDKSGPFQMQISALDYSSYVGTIGVGRISRGQLKRNDQVTLINPNGDTRNCRIIKIMGYLGLERIEVDTAQAGDIVAITGIDKLNISDTLCDPAQVEALPALTVDEPTVNMTFQVNDSPFVGQAGKNVTSRKLRERLDQELIHNVALRVEPGSSSDQFRVSGRGELHLAILIENMRREGYELAVSCPEVIFKEIDGKRMEPFEMVTIDIELQHQGTIMEQLGARRGDLLTMTPDGQDRVRLDYRVPARGLMGFHTLFLSLTSGTGIMHHVFDGYSPQVQLPSARRMRGVLISIGTSRVRAVCLGLPTGPPWFPGYNSHLGIIRFYVYVF